MAASKSPRPPRWQFSKNRLEAFSDGVFAIVITLLVLQIKIPKLSQPGNTAITLHELLQSVPQICSWVVSFFFVALIWLHHHQIMHMSRVANYRVVWINTFLLLFVSFLPFPTALMGNYPGAPLILTLWGLTMCAVSLSLAFLYAYCTRHFLKPSYHAPTVRRNVALSFLAGPLLYLLAAISSWWSVTMSYGLYILVPLLYITPLDKERDDVAG